MEVLTPRPEPHSQKVLTDRDFFVGDCKRGRCRRGRGRWGGSVGVRLFCSVANSWSMRASVLAMKLATFFRERGVWRWEWDLGEWHLDTEYDNPGGNGSGRSGEILETTLWRG